MEIEIPNSAQIGATIEALPMMFKHWLPILLMLMAISINPQILIPKKQKEVKPYIRKRGRLTLDKLKTYDGFENISDEEGQKVVSAIAQTANLICESFINHKKLKKWNRI